MGEAWQTAIGLQAVDGLKTSAYLLNTEKLLGEKTFQFSPAEWLNSSIKQKDLVEQTGKSLSTVKRIIDALQEKG